MHCWSRSVGRQVSLKWVRRSVSKSAASPMASSNPTTWRFSCCGGKGLPDADLDAPVPRLRHILGRRKLRLAPAAARDRYPNLGDAELQELGAAALRPPTREEGVALP